MSIKRALLLTSLLAVAGQAQAQSSDLFGEAEIKQLEGQDIDANVRLLEALTRAAKKGPSFRVSPDKIFMNIKPGEVGAQTIRVSNVGDEDGSVNGINPVGRIEGLSVSDNCPPALAPGGYCDVAVRFTAERPMSVQTVILASLKERSNSSVDIPVSISVVAPPEPEAEVVEEPQIGPSEPVVVLVKEPEHKGPSSKDVALRYFSGSGYFNEQTPASRYVRVSLPTELKDQRFTGVAYNDVKVVSETSDRRYPETVSAVDASLPVDREHILTADRVIKAVLDTPVSNVMCGKVVAVIESDVYSTTGGEPLIQAGSRAIGSCGEFADERVGISWNRIITTDGRSISFDDGATRTSDASGLGGGLGRVYRSNFDRFVLPVISTVIDTAAGLIFANFGEDETVVTTSDGNVVQSTAAANEGLEIITENARGTAQELISEIRDVREVMVLPAGSRIDLEITDDIYFNQSRDVVRVGDTSYELDEIARPNVGAANAAGIELVDYREGMSGPVVRIDGRRYVVKAQEGPVTERAVPVTAGNSIVQQLIGDEK